MIRYFFFDHPLVQQTNFKIVRFLTNLHPRHFNCTKLNSSPQMNSGFGSDYGPNLSHIQFIIYGEILFWLDRIFPDTVWFFLVIHSKGLCNLAKNEILGGNKIWGPPWGGYLFVFFADTSAEKCLQEIKVRHDCSSSVSALGHFYFQLYIDTWIYIQS